jgi:microsomal dipeptidase-like Zn-dependent dipeptidase
LANQLNKRAAGALIAAATGTAAAAAGLALSAVPAVVERRRNRVFRPGPYHASARAVEFHRTLTVVDLHADSLLWGRDLGRRARRGHVDIPRLIEGGVALQGMAVSTKVPRRANLERNDDRTDDVTLLALAQRWPRATWDSLLARALHQAMRLRAMAADSAGQLTLIESRADLARYLVRRSVDPAITAAFLAIEGAHTLEDEPANVEILAAAGYRMISPTHFFDTAFGGSAHGVRQGGLTELGRDLLSRMEAGGLVMDVAHASSATIDDVLAIAARPIVASHTGVRAAADNRRNLPDDQVRGIAATGGLVGIGFWPVASGGEDVRSIARSVVAAILLAGVEHVGLGSDFDGGVPTPFDATGMPLLTEALLAEGLSEADIGAVMGGTAVRLLEAALPA